MRAPPQTFIIIGVLSPAKIINNVAKGSFASFSIGYGKRVGKNVLVLTRRYSQVNQNFDN